MNGGVLLDPRTGRPSDQALHYRDYLAGGLDVDAAIAAGRLPASVGEHLRAARAHPRASGPTATKQGFYEVLAVDLADGTQIVNSTAEALITNDYTFGAYDPHLYPGAAFKIECQFDVSNVVTTPGTLTFRVRWGGLTGTVLAQSAAIALSTTARTSFSGSLDILLVWRTIGAAGSAFCQGKVFLNDVPVAADSAPQGVYTMGSAGANVPAVVSSLSTAATEALSVTAQFSVGGAGTQLTNHIRVLSSLN